MIALWSTREIETNDTLPPGFDVMPFRTQPPLGCPSIYLSEDDFTFRHSELFTSDEYFDLAFPAPDRNMKEFLQSIRDWSDFPFWVAHRDTLQTRWLRRVAEKLTGHLGNAILILMERKAIVIKVV